MSRPNDSPEIVAFVLSQTLPDVQRLLAQESWTVSDLLTLSAKLSAHAIKAADKVCSWKVPASGNMASENGGQAIAEAELDILTVGIAFPIMAEGFSAPVRAGEHSIGPPFPPMPARTDDKVCSVATRLVSRIAMSLRTCLAHIADPRAFSEALEVDLQVELRPVPNAASELPVPVIVASSSDAFAIYGRVRSPIMSLLKIFKACAPYCPARSRISNRPDLLDMIVGCAPFREHVQEAFQTAADEWDEARRRSAVRELVPILGLLVCVIAAEPEPYRKHVRAHPDAMRRAATLIQAGSVLFATAERHEAASGDVDPAVHQALVHLAILKMLSGCDGPALGEGLLPSQQEADERMEAVRTGSVPLPDRCDACLAQAPVMACSKCKLARYCSVDCQRADWKDHKRSCYHINPNPARSS
ncbi:hypothetical protein DFJ74DRAFT_775291 [Hyaloraphidium curvatum]|nr:hypothetical protein DFJ74DRAFT_775291 [Hyaloraphidium curvatum]